MEQGFIRTKLSLKLLHFIDFIKLIMDKKVLFLQASSTTNIKMYTHTLFMSYIV